MAKVQTGNRVYGGLNNEERIAQRRQKFIDAGIEIFGTEGYHAATIRKLCKQAKLTSRYFYESFDSIEDLLINAFDQCTQRIAHHIMLALPIASTDDDLAKVIPSILDAFFTEIEDRRVARLIMLEVLGVSKTVDSFCNERLLFLGDLLTRLSRTAHPDWTRNDEERALLSASVLGAMRQAAIHWIASDYKMDRDKVVSTTSLLVFGVLTMLERKSRQSDD